MGRRLLLLLLSVAVRLVESSFSHVLVELLAQVTHLQNFELHLLDAGGGGWLPKALMEEAGISVTYIRLMEIEKSTSAECDAAPPLTGDSRKSKASASKS